MFIVRVFSSRDYARAAFAQGLLAWLMMIQPE
jgi:hypothetical protein